MAGWRQAVALAMMTGEEIEALTALSRTEPAGWVSRAAMLLGYREEAFQLLCRGTKTWRASSRRCSAASRASSDGLHGARLRHLMTDRDLGKEPTITPEAKAWLVSLACDKASGARLSA